ncbi:phosphotransferase [Neotabrizicola sp. sgz301269]|uniref:phosphotransferase n=1 Tax=Neotabrizicola sp. sgz301269 TaxID=3276282 RepID=UPI00376F6C2C
MSPDTASEAFSDILSHPPPRLSQTEILGHLARHWGLEGDLTALTAERDLNHRLDGPQGRFTVKLANPAEPMALTAFQSKALMHVAKADPDLPVPRVVPTATGDLWVDLPQGRLRLMSWLEGKPQAQTPFSAPQARAIGALLARLTLALADYDGAGADPVILWDIQRLPRLAAMLPDLPDRGFAAWAGDFIERFEAQVAPQLALLPRQVCHSDFNRHNILTAADDPDRITGVIDFGDMVRTPRICDLAVAAAYQLDPADPLGGPCALIQGYAARIALSGTEVALLPELIAARMVTSLVISGWRAARYPSNAEYILRNSANARAGLAAFENLGRDALAHALTLAARPEE